MEKLFGLQMSTLMFSLLGTFLAAAALIGFFALRNRVMLKMGLRPIPRRPAQTMLIVVGVMLSTVIISAAFGTGDTLSYSIRAEVLRSLETIDMLIIPARKKTADDRFGGVPYIPYVRFEQIRRDLDAIDDIDGVAPQIGESVPAVNLRTSQSEGDMRIAGIPPALPQSLGEFSLTSGEPVRVEDLAENEAYINDAAAKELDAKAGDELRLVLRDGSVHYRVKGVVERGGMAGRDPTMLMPLSRAQDMFDKEGQINSIVISNRGDELEGAKVSKDVAKDLRVLFHKKEVAVRLKELLNQPAVLEALQEEEERLGESLQAEVATLRTELGREELSEELISLLGDMDVVDALMGALEEKELKEVAGEAFTLFDDLGEFEIIEAKRRGLQSADEGGSFITTFFMAFSMFSITVGILLIFLIFVLLAAARRSEMGMARAVGAKRRHLVQMFVFEGTAYSLLSAAIGVVLGLTISALMVGVINRLIASFDEDFQLTVHFEPRTVVVSYCLGMVITLVTVAISSYRVSRLNIVAAVRDLPTPIVVSSLSWREVLLDPPRAMARPFRLGWQAAGALVTLQPKTAAKLIGQTLRAVALVPVAIIRSLGRVGVRFFMQGWLALALGLGLALWGVMGLERDSVFSTGASLTVIGIGLMLRTGLRRTALRPEVRDRIAFTFTGVTMLVFWVLPVSVMKRLVGELEGDFDMMFASGIFMVAAAVWTVMYNADLLLRALSFATGRFGRMRPVLVTAVAYPLSSKFRTGLTLAMFALVIFTLMVMSVLTETFGSMFNDPDTVTGGWHIRGRINFNTPIEDIRQSIDERPDLTASNFQAIGSYTDAAVQVHQIEADSQRWRGVHVWAASDDLLAASEYKIKTTAEGFGPAGRPVWQALMDDPTLVVVDGWAVATREGVEGGEEEPWIEKTYYENEEPWSAVEIEVKEPQTGVTANLKIIGVLDRVHDHAPGIIVSKSLLDNALPFPVPITNYQFKLAEGLGAKEVAKSLEASFLEHGMDAESWREHLAKEAAGGRAFFRLFTAFMALGLLVGVAALGVVSTRAVVERRQQIGVLRAIGYRRRMIWLSFLLESSFISLLGIIIGTVLGITLGYQAYTDIKQEEGLSSLRFGIPWVQIGIILAMTYLFSLLATYLPARQASRIYPAEALRYE